MSVKMDTAVTCRCCLLRPSDKDLKSIYTYLGKSEVFADMLKECFEIHVSINSSEGYTGICEVCVTRLRDAFDFKKQVTHCQKEIQTKLASLKEDTPKVKMELVDLDEVNNDDGIYFDLKQEFADIDNLKAEESEDDKKLAEILGLKRSDLTVKRKGDRKKKPTITIDKNKKTISSRKTIKINLRDFRSMSSDKPNILITTSSRLTTETRKHKANLDSIIKYSNCTPFANKTIFGYVCAYCKTTFQEPEELRTHTDTHRKEELIVKRSDRYNISIKMDITQLKCNICNTSVNVISNLKKHLTKEHDIKFHPDIKDYILEFKLTNSETLDCALCHSTYETFKMLLQHMNGHYRNYVCEVCDLGFVNKHRLRNHQRTHETGTFKCEFCDKVFSTRVRKVCHEKYSHNSTARYTTNCPHCDQSFTSYYQRNRHMFNEHNTSAASYKCNICNKSFILKSKLTSHIKKVHLMERNHICAECGQGFFIKQSLDEHMIKHNGERVHQCTVCHKAYARKKTLREHMRIHNNDRRFKCGVCGLAFVQKCSLKSHMLSNHGVTLSEFENTRSEVGSPQVSIS